MNFERRLSAIVAQRSWLWGQRASCPLTAAAWFDLVLSESEAQQYTLLTTAATEAQHSGELDRGRARQKYTTGVGLIEVYRIQ
jgi:hypothetical protein